MQLYYFLIGAIIIIAELVFLGQMLVNFRYVIKKTHKKRTIYKPKTALLVPCKGIDAAFKINISSLLKQDHDDFVLWFVLGGQDDPAYQVLCKLRDQLGPASKAKEIRILIAGQARTSSQKIHNLLYCCRQLPPDIQVIAFADSDACFRPDWLMQLLHPLRQDRVGISTGYRWFVPKRNNVATLVLSAVNAKIAQLLGAYRFNQAWGGSMAVRMDVFKNLEIEKAWSTSVSDDLSLSYLIKKAKMKIAFVPACLVPSYEETTWPGFFEFARRQFIITRICVPGTWWFGFISSSYSVLAMFSTAAIAVLAFVMDWHRAWAYAVVPVIMIMVHLLLALLRQAMIFNLLPAERKRLRLAAAVDIAASWLLSLILLITIASSLFGRKITWRGITYRIDGPTSTTVESNPSQLLDSGSPTR